MYSLYYVSLFPYFPVCFDQTYNYLHTAACGFCFVKLLNQSYLKLYFSFSFFFSPTGLPWLCLQHLLIKTEIWKDPDLLHHMIPVSENSKCLSSFAVMYLTLFSTYSLISTLHFSFFFPHVICVGSHKFGNLHFYSSTKFPSTRLISSWEFRNSHLIKMLVLRFFISSSPSNT